MKVYIKRSLSLILVFLIVFTYVNLPKNIVYGAVSYNGQTAAGNYTIGTTTQLNLLSQRVNTGTTYEGSTFTLISNIVYDSSIVNNFRSIGGEIVEERWNGTTYGIFKGTFDGNGFHISGINISQEKESKEHSYKGTCR